MNKLSVRLQEGQLLICRRKLPCILVLCGYVLLFLSVMTIPFLGAFVYHKHESGFYELLAVALPMLLVCLYYGASYLKPWTFIFNREHNFVIFNEKVVCTLAEVQSVHVGKEYLRAGRETNIVLKLSFQTMGGTEEEIGNSGLYGPNRAEMERVGAVVAEYAGVEIYKPEY